MKRSLDEYNRKRHFGRTSEPRGEKQQREGFSFVVQKHDASRLHYDFRLELDGVLLSWAVPKGPSLDPGVKRMAVQTEDHPVEYGGFEGVIPKGEYGGGSVVVWDRGHWVPDGDARADYQRGRLTFRLEGEKLKGGFHLVRTRPRGNAKQQSWLLIKRNDEHAKRGSEAAIVEMQPQSVLSGRTVEEVAQDPDRVWHSNKSAKKTPATAKTAAKATAKAKAKAKAKTKASAKRAKKSASWPDPSELSAVRKGALPEFVEPQLATLVSEAPAGEAWLHEIKLDGYRMQLRCDGKDITWLTRRGHDWSERLPSISAELSALGLPPALLDGELVVLQSGVSNFQQLQNSLNEQHDGRVVYYAFDLLHLAGYDLRAVPLLERKALLAALLQAAGSTHETSRIRLSGHVVGQGDAFFARACELGVEGSVCKRADGRYASGRSRDWLKVKCTQRQEFVIGGFSEPSGARSHFGALLLGVQGEGGLEYAGRVGTGFSERSLAELHEKLTPLERPRPAFVAPPRGADARGVHWVEPELVAEVEFAERTSDGLVRHASFRGLRDDKAAGQVREERPEPVSAARKAGARAKAGSAKSKATKSKATKSKVAKSKVAKSATPSQPLPALRSVRLTHPDRVLYAEQGITKADLALYYAQVAERMLPQVARRPLMIVRCPRGQGAECFHQKHPGQGMSAAIKRVKIAESKGVLESMYVEDAEGLVQLVQMGA
ncbi:MAG TPA: DNA ligase D, partial [Polyangiales bacterium]|nr:DNA ligase D [Polyangiales bacterium]